MSSLRLSCSAALGKLVIVCGGHGSEAGWFRTKTTVYHNDIVIMDRSTSVQWRLPKVLGDVPAPREYHTLTAVSPTRALLFGGRNIIATWSKIPDCKMGA